MTDNDLIISFIEYNYKFKGFSKESAWFYVTDLSCGENINRVSFLERVIESLSNFKTQDNITVEEITTKWFQDYVDEILTDIQTFLDENIVVKLGLTNWDVLFFSGQQFSKEKLINMYKHKYHESLIDRVFEDWYSHRVIEETEKIMNIS